MNDHAEPIAPRPPRKPRKKKDKVACQLELRMALEELGIAVHFDEFKLEVTLEKPLLRPGITPPADFQPRAWTDYDDTALAEVLNEHGFRQALKGNLLRDVIVLQARTRRTVHPVREYLDGLRWDGFERVEDFFISYCHALDDLNDDPDAISRDPRLHEQADDRLHDRVAYLRAAARIFFLSAVARIFEPGCKQDYMIVLEGENQGENKSKLLRLLARRDEWFGENPPERLDKDAALWLVGIWLVEYAEFDRYMSGQRFTKFKGWVSQQSDRFRPPYARTAATVSRQCILAGTTNRTDYLHDRTGNRRYFPVSVVAIDFDSVREDLDQLWAEAVAMYRKGVQRWPDADITAIAKAEQAARLDADPWEVTIAKETEARPATYDHGGITTAKCFDLLHIPVKDRTRADEMRIADILKGLGFTRRRRESRKGEGRPYVYRKPQQPQDAGRISPAGARRSGATAMCCSGSALETCNFT